MKILSAIQIRAADRQTILEERITSTDLMERASIAFTGWFENKFPQVPAKTILICCGPGNNGGDGLAIARLLHAKNYLVTVWIISSENNYSPDFSFNRRQLPAAIPITYIRQEKDIPDLASFDIIIDGLFGTGLSRPVTGIFAAVIAKINQSKTTIIAIDVPSGLFTEKQNEPQAAIIEAAYTVSFELPKLAFFLPQHEKYVGNWGTVPINLSSKYIASARTSHYVITENIVAAIIKPRKKFSHKGTYGHALLLGGSFGKMGALVLSARACLRSGIGLLTVQCPKVGYQIMQISVPEAMTITDKGDEYLAELPEIKSYQAIGIGPGLGKATATKDHIRQLLQAADLPPLVLDADALNILSEEPELLNQLPANSILTPHPKEFKRLVGPAENDYHRLELLKEFCQKYTCYVVLKGGHTCIGTPDGELYFNCTGNPGMATGGTGDALTGIITALVAQKYTPLQACLVGIYIHGLAGDLAKGELGEEALLASDLINQLGKAFLKLKSD